MERNIWIEKKITKYYEKSEGWKCTKKKIFK